jgi:hypothetical protein
MRLCGLCLLLLVGLSTAAFAQDAPSRWQKASECTEYLPKKAPCRITIPVADVSNGMNAAPSHVDVAIYPGAQAVVVLTNVSPLMKCTVASSPAALTRDASASISTFITSLAGFGLPGANPRTGAPAPAPPLSPAAIPCRDAAGKDCGAKLEAIKLDADIQSSEQLVTQFWDQYDQEVRDLTTAKKTVTANWKYSYSTDAEFAAAVKRIHTDLKQMFLDPLPSSDDQKAANQAIGANSTALDTFRKKYTDAAGQLQPAECNAVNACIQGFQDWLSDAEGRVRKTKSDMRTLPAQVQSLLDVQAALKPAFVWLNLNSIPEGSGDFPVNSANPWTTAYLPLTVYAQKQVTEAITCKDVASQTQVFDVITFTAYYEAAAAWDLSAGAFVSLVPARQVGVVSGPLPTPTPTLAITSQAPVQFIPGAIFELHPSRLNFRCPWAKDGRRFHPWGYVCSFGPAVGFLLNPNNGATNGEFFEGVSFGINRFSFLLGNHTGRFQQFAEGYAIGQTVPMGTMPPTDRRWTNHPAFGFSYRIPIR